MTPVGNRIDSVSISCAMTMRPAGSTQMRWKLSLLGMRRVNVASSANGSATPDVLHAACVVLLPRRRAHAVAGAAMGALGHPMDRRHPLRQ
jgi:hypothetical protein